MSIHSDHPFLPPESERDPVRRFRGRLAQPVTLWCAQDGASRAGWTVSSLVLAEGEPPEVLGLVDVDSDLAVVAGRSGAVAISLLRFAHRGLAEAFAGLAPAPGGPFRQGSWRQTDWGPVLDGAAGWLGVELTDSSSTLGWSRVLRGRCARIGVDTGASDVLTHLRGRYRELSVEST